jgi:hypothetical protein
VEGVVQVRGERADWLCGMLLLPALMVVLC